MKNASVSPVAINGAQAKSKSKSKSVTPTQTENSNSASVAIVSSAIRSVYDAGQATKPTPGPFQVTDSKGRVYRSQKATLVKCLHDISEQVQEVVAVTVMFNKADAAEFTFNYLRNRRTNPNREKDITRRFNLHEFVRDWPTLALNKAGDGNNGMHTCHGFLKSNVATFEFVILLGTDVAMGTRIDTGKPRSPADQGSYIEPDVYDGVEPQGERQNMVAAASYVFVLAAGRKMWNIGLTETEAKSKLCQHPVGQRLLRQCNQPFRMINDVLRQAALEGYGEFEPERYQRVIGYVPALILCLIGKGEWVEPLFTGSKRGDRELLLVANRLMEKLSPTRGEASRREGGEIRHMIFDILSPLYSKLTRVPYAPFLPRFEMVMDKKLGQTRTVKIDYNSKDLTPEKRREYAVQLSRDARKRRDITTYFISQIELKG